MLHSRVIRWVIANCVLPAAIALRSSPESGLPENRYVKSEIRAERRDNR